MIDEPTKKFDKHKWLGRLFAVSSILIFAVVNMGLGASLAQEHYADAAYFGALGLFWLGFMLISHYGAVADAGLDATLAALERVKAVIDRVEDEKDGNIMDDIEETHDKLLAKVFRKIVKEVDPDSPPTDAQIVKITEKFKDITGHDVMVTVNPDGFIDVEIDHDHHGKLDGMKQTELPIEDRGQGAADAGTPSASTETATTQIPVKDKSGKPKKVAVKRKKKSTK